MVKANEKRCEIGRKTNETRCMVCERKEYEARKQNRVCALVLVLTKKKEIKGGRQGKKDKCSF